MIRSTSLAAIDRINRQRAVLATVQHAVDPRAIIGDTGGGCTAIFVPVGELTAEMRGAWPTYWLITDDAETPDRHDVFLQVGLYQQANDVERYVCFNVPNLACAIALIGSLACHQL